MRQNQMLKGIGKRVRDEFLLERVRNPTFGCVNVNLREKYLAMDARI